MNPMVRLVALVVAAVVIVGAGWFVLQPKPAPTGAERIAEGGCYTAAVNDKYYSFGRWFLVANQRGERVDWDPKGMTCDQPAGTADVLVQITHREAQRDTSEIKTERSTIVQDVVYNRERYKYRFDCKNRQIAALERIIMGDGEAVLRSTALNSGQADFKPYGEGGIGVALDDEVCGTGMGLR